MPKDPQYSNRELDRMFTEIKDILKSQDNILVSIESQTTRTNGRVSTLENEKWFTRGVMAVLTMLVLPVAFIVIKILLNG